MDAGVLWVWTAGWAEFVAGCLGVGASCVGADSSATRGALAAATSCASSLSRSARGGAGAPCLSVGAFSDCAGGGGGVGMPSLFFGRADHVLGPALFSALGPQFVAPHPCRLGGAAGLSVLNQTYARMAICMSILMPSCPWWAMMALTISPDILKSSSLATALYPLTMVSMLSWYILMMSSTETPCSTGSNGFFNM